MKKLNNGAKASIMIALLAGILAVELAHCFRVSRYTYKEVRGVMLGIEQRKWVWE